MAADRYVSREEIAEELGVEERTITNWVKAPPANAPGPFPCRVRGRNRTFPRRKCLAWYIEFKVAEGLARAAPAQPTDLVEAERRKAVADAELAELKVAQLRGDLVPVALFREEVSRPLQRVRARLMTVPGEFGPRFVGLSEVGQAVQRLRDLVDATLSELRETGAADDEDDATAVA